MRIHETYAKLGEVHPEDVGSIIAEEKHVTELLNKQEYYELPTTKRLIAACRKDIAAARLKLGTIRTLSDGQRSELWGLVDSHEWFIRMVAKDYTAELELIDRALEAELSR
jgi:hypothetical protein